MTSWVMLAVAVAILFSVVFYIRGDLAFMSDGQLLKKYRSMGKFVGCVVSGHVSFSSSNDLSKVLNRLVSIEDEWILRGMTPYSIEQFIAFGVHKTELPPPSMSGWYPQNTARYYRDVLAFCGSPVGVPLEATRDLTQGKRNMLSRVIRGCCDVHRDGDEVVG